MLNGVSTLLSNQVHHVRFETCDRRESALEINELNCPMIGHSRMSWVDFQKATPADMMFMWMDLDGLIRSKALPEKCPRASHLWAWNKEKLIRARIDDGWVIWAELLLENSGTGATAGDGGKKAGVDVWVYAPLVWPRGEGRLSKATQKSLPSGNVKIYELIDLAPIQFVLLEDEGEEMIDNSCLTGSPP